MLTYRAFNQDVKIIEHTSLASTGSLCWTKPLNELQQKDKNNLILKFNSDMILISSLEESTEDGNCYSTE